MNKRSCQYPICFLWDDQPNDYKINYTTKSPRVTSTSTIKHILAESEFKCVYDKNTTDVAEIYITCNILEKAYHLGVNLTDTIRDVKNHIKRLEKIPIALLHLFCNEILLRDTNTLQNCGIKNKSTLTMGIKLHTARCDNCKKSYVPAKTTPTEVTLNSLNGDVYQVEVSLVNPAEELKELIDEKYKIFPDNQLIMYNGKKIEDDVPLEEYGITNESNLFLLKYQYDNCCFCTGCAKSNGSPTIILKFLNNKITCLLNPQNTVRQLKEISYQYLHHIHPDLQQLLFNNVELHDSKTLDECGVKNGSTIQVKLRFDQRKCDKCKESLL